ncbi:hypothetical protein AB85_0277 [Escherichia coli 2-156-04_S3_C1]|nr:hypothetical protein AB85_0277 [Escherichia coli 2-156-04_S3_C1]
MPTQNNDDKISLVIAGRSHSDWSSYRIDSDFLKREIYFRRTGSRG